MGTAIRFIKQSVEPVGPCPSDENGLLKRIELCGRVAYKSEDKITDDSAGKFVEHLKGLGHLSVLEHSNIVLMEHGIQKGLTNLYERFGERGAFHRIHYGKDAIGYISGNLRAWIETLDYFVAVGKTDLARDYAVTLAIHYAKICSGYLTRFFESNTGLHVVPVEKQLECLRADPSCDLPIFTFKVTCDRGISHELVRHRVMSFTQESTRYVNYGKRGVTFILPEILEPRWDEGSGLMKPGLPVRAANFRDALDRVATQYEVETSMSMKPQIARDLLPNLLKTELYISGRFSHWKHFVKLRESKAAHPRVQVIAKAIREYFEGIGLTMDLA